MIEHDISGSLQQWWKVDEKIKNGPEIWRGYIVAKLFYGDEERLKFPFLVYRSCRAEDDRWMVCIYLNSEGQWQGKFILLPDEQTAQKLMANLEKPEFKHFVECLSPLVPPDFEMPKRKKQKDDTNGNPKKGNKESK